MRFDVVDCNTHFGVLPYKDTDVSLEKLISTMEAHGVRGAMSYSLKGVAYDFVVGNDETLDAPVLPVATVDPRRHIGVVEEIEKRRKQGFVALRVFPEQQGWRFGSVMMKPIIRELERLGMPLMVACGGNGPVNDLLSMIEGCSFPVIVHSVGYGNLAEIVAALKENPNLYADTQINDTPDSLAVAVDAVGAERFVFGSGSPSTSMRCALNGVLEAEIADEQKAQIFSGNISRILGLPAAESDVKLNLDKPFAGMPIIDVHAHYGKWPFPMRRWGVEYSLELMRKHGISKAIMSSALGIVYDFVEGNREMADAIEGHPEILGYVTVNPNYFDASCRELEEYYKKTNFVGAKIHPAYCRQPINAPKTRALVRKIAEYGRPMLIHTYGPATPGQIRDIANDCPNLPIIMGHGGADAWREAAEVVRDCPNVYIEFCCSGLETDKVRRVIQVAGDDKVLFGTDLDLIHPAFVAGCYEEACLTPTEKEKILYKNALRLFGMEP